MKVMFDLNVVLDVVQRREPHYHLSAAALSAVVQGDVQGLFPCHGVTTVHYLVSRHANTKRADELVDWLSNRLEIGTAGRQEFARARSADCRFRGCGSMRHCRGLRVRRYRDTQSG